MVLLVTGGWISGCSSGLGIKGYAAKVSTGSLWPRNVSPKVSCYSDRRLPTEEVVAAISAYALRNTPVGLYRRLVEPTNDDRRSYID